MGLELKIIILLVLLGSAAAALFGYGHHEYTRGHDDATATANQKIDGLKIAAAAKLSEVTAANAATEKTLRDKIQAQEVQDANHTKTESTLRDQLRVAGGTIGRLRDPNATTGCRGGSGGTVSTVTPTSPTDADDPTQGNGLLSAQLTELLERNASEADTINDAYASCRAWVGAVTAGKSAAGIP